MRTELEKMLAGEPYASYDPALRAAHKRAKELEPPFYCDYGSSASPSRSDANLLVRNS